MFRKEIQVNSLDELKEFAEKFSSCLKGKELILLIGDLGSGKTRFTQFLVSAIDRELGEEVTSPTFSVMNIYETKKFPIYHLDLYRVKNFDVSEIVGKGILVVEWPDDSITEIEGTPTIILRFNICDEHKRKIEIQLKNANYLHRCI